MKKNKEDAFFLCEMIGEISEQIIADAKNTRVYMIKRLITAAVAVVLIASTVITAVALNSKPEPADIVTIEADFPIVLSLDAEGTVTLVKTDAVRARDLLKGTDYTGLPLNAAATELTKLLIENDIISQSANTVMVSSTAGSQEQTARTVFKVLTDKGISPAVLSTKLKGNEYLSFSEKKGVSRAKAKLITEIATQTDCSVRSLLNLKIGELNLISQAHGIVYEDISSQGKTDSRLLLGEKEAARRAVENYRIDSSDIRSIFYSLDASQNGLFYSIKIKTETETFICILDAYSGELLKAARSVSSDGKDPAGDRISTPLTSLPKSNPGSSVSDSGSSDPTDSETDPVSAETSAGSSVSDPKEKETGETRATATAAPSHDPIYADARSSDSFDGQKLDALLLGSVDLLSWNAFSKEQLAVVYSKEQMEELVSGYSSLKYAPEALDFSGSDLLSDEFYQNWCAAVLIVYPQYNPVDLTGINSLSFDSAYLSGDRLSLNFTDTKTFCAHPYAQFIRLRRADAISAASIR